MAYRYYSLTSYPHHCFFSKIQNTKISLDSIAFFLYFTFEDWIDVVMFEAPLQFFNFMFIHDWTAMAFIKIHSNGSSDYSIFSILTVIYQGMGDSSPDFVNTTTYVLLIVSITIWGLKIVRLLFAFLVFIPTHFIIGTNLKLYCLKKIDLRFKLFNN
jgi:hypothetical protein